MGRCVSSEEVVCTGRPGQLCGPGMAHQATAAHRQRQHSCQPKVFKTGVYVPQTLGLGPRLGFLVVP